MLSTPQRRGHDELRTTLLDDVTQLVVLSRTTLATAVESLTDTRARILEGAFRAVATHGLSRFTVDDVARAADLSRQSVYRYFDSRDALVQALVLREEEAFLDGVRAAFSEHRDLEDAVTAAILFCLRAAREHPLLDRLLRAEPEVLLPYLTTRGEPMVDRARAVLEGMLARRGGLRRTLVGRGADLAVRAIVSYVLTPSQDPPEVIAAEATRVLLQGVRANGKERR